MEAPCHQEEKLKKKIKNKKKKKKNNKKSEVGRHVSCDRELKKKLEGEVLSKSQVPLSTCYSNGTGKRLKLPRKRLLEFEDYNGVYCSSVPRKLRSAMKKHNQESPSFPNSKKLNCFNDGVESPQMNVLKKPEIEEKHGISDWSPRWSVCGPITKDEEEVVEALYALAGMFHDDLCNDRHRLDNPSLDASLSASLEMRDVPPAAPEVKEEMPPSNSTRDDKACQPEYNAERSLEVTAKVGSLNDQELLTGQPKTQEQSSLLNSDTFCIQSMLLDDISTLKQPAKLEVSHLHGKPEVKSMMITAAGKQLDQLHASNKSQKNALWPGMASVASTHAWSHGSSKGSFAAECPPWLDTALITVKPVSLPNGSSIGKIARDECRKSWKRCATHLHICCLIQKLQIANIPDALPLHPDQLTQDKISNQAVLLTMNINGVKHGLNATRSNGIGLDTFKNHSNDAGGVFQQKILQQQAPSGLSSGAYSYQKHSVNFLSLSIGDNGLKVDDGIEGNKNEQETSNELQCQPFHSNFQSSVNMQSISMSLGYPSSPFTNQSLAASPWQVRTQQPAYHTDPNSLTKQYHKQLRHQEQRQIFWAAQLPAQYRNTGMFMSMSMNQYHASAMARPDLPTLTLCSQPDVPPSTWPIEVLSSKYHQISEHQQHVTTINSSLPQTRMKWRDYRLSSGYDDNEGGFQTGSALPLQLLCNERL